MHVVAAGEWARRGASLALITDHLQVVRLPCSLSSLLKGNQFVQMYMRRGDCLTGEKKEVLGVSVFIFIFLKDGKK